MGGWGSGRHGGRRTTESQKRIEIMRMKRHGWLKHGYQGTLSWSCRGEEIGRIGFRINGRIMTLNYRYREERCKEWEPVEAKVMLDQTPCNYGGYRIWMRCPHCYRRCAILYLAGKYPACRKCYNLGYSSESEGALDRALRQARKSQEKLGYYEGDITEWLPRPKGMHMKTYQRHLQKIRRGNRMFCAEVARRFNLAGEESPF